MDLEIIHNFLCCSQRISGCDTAHPHHLRVGFLPYTAADVKCDLPDLSWCGIMIGFVEATSGNGM